MTYELAVQGVVVGLGVAVAVVAWYTWKAYTSPRPKPRRKRSGR